MVMEGEEEMVMEEEQWRGVNSVCVQRQYMILTILYPVHGRYYTSIVVLTDLHWVQVGSAGDDTL